MNSHTFDTEKWQSMSIFAQMGNIGSEVGRAAKAYSNEDKDSFDGAFRRAIDLFHATTDGLVASKSPRVREVLLARDAFVSQYYGNIPEIDASLESYFMQYAIADRLTR
jgi:hypothetical protein